MNHSRQKLIKKNVRMGRNRLKTLSPQSILIYVSLFGVLLLVIGKTSTPLLSAEELDSNSALVFLTGANNFDNREVESPADSLRALIPFAACGTATGDLGGVVWRDLDNDGVKDSADPNFDGTNNGPVIATAYNESGQVAQVTVGTDGSYNFDDIFTTHSEIRIEFTGLPDWTQTSMASGANGTTVQHYSAATCAADLAIHIPADYCENNPNAATTCFVTSDPESADGPYDVLVKWPFERVGNDVNAGSWQMPTSLAAKSDIGSVWGLAYARQSETLYSAAFLKRHVGLNELDPVNNSALANPLAVIYATDADTGDNTVFIDLSTAGVDVGTIGNNAARGLNINPDEPSTDATAYPLVGKIGLGDVEISADESTLYAVNLNDKELVSIDINANGTAGSVNKYAITDPSCVDGEHRPFALKMYQGEIYIGTICDGSTSGDPDDMTATVQRWDGGTNFTSMVTFDLDYTKGKPRNDGTCGNYPGWFTWLDTFPPVCRNSAGGGWDEVIYVYPQPILSDIEFDTDGSMVLGFMDRLGHQMGFRNATLTDINSTNNITTVGGDILRVHNNNGTYVLESNGTAGSYTTSGANNGEGPGGGEFYPNENGGGHNENSFGGLTLHPSRGEIMLSMLRPDNAGVGTGGVARFGSTTGNLLGAYALYQGANNTNPPNLGSDYTAGYFGKAAGLGDVELLCAAAPIEIGNYVWFDANENGIQDPSESGEANVTVTLHDIDDGGAQVGSATTSGTGQYYFGGIADTNMVSGTLKTATNYEVRISLADGNLTENSVTTQNANGIATNDNKTDLADNDASEVSGNAVIAFTTGSAGENNHTLDFGFREARALDFGDLPDSFDTTNAENGARHTITNTLYLGACVDTELDGQPAADGFAGLGSDGDDHNGVIGDATGTCATVGDDEDGVNLITPLIPSAEACVKVTAVNGTGGNANFYGWIDFDGDGQYDADADDILNTGDFTGGSISIADGGVTDEEYCFTTPASATFAGGETHLRFRLTADDLSISATPWNGAADDGEVEDYYQPLACVGSYVWTDTDGEGDQDETTAGIEDVTVNLVWYGVDNALGGGDDRVYTDTTDANGEYHFCGLLPKDGGDNRGSYEIQIPAAELDGGELSNMVLSPTGTGTVDQDSNGAQVSATDPITSGMFMIAQPNLTGVGTIFSLPTAEDGTGDDDGNLPPSAAAPFPDSSDDVTFDFGFIAVPDRGDLPDSFDTTAAENGPSHIIDSDLYLGSCVDNETDGQPDAVSGTSTIGGDDHNGVIGDATGTCVVTGDDEDGIELVTPLIPGNQACIEVTANNNTGGDARLYGWFDFDGDGQFDGDTDDLLSTVDFAGGRAIVPDGGVTNQDYCFTVPAGATHDGGESHMRFRLTTDDLSVSATPWNGAASDGEVEDYYTPLACVGNYVWAEADTQNDNQEAADFGLNGVDVNLVWFGPDGALGGLDDLVYTTTTATAGGEDGIYHFCGLIPDDGSGNGDYRIEITNPPALFPAAVTADSATDDTDDSDGTQAGGPGTSVDGPTFSITGTLPTGEASIGDDPGNINGYPDGSDYLTFDFGFIGTDLGDLPESGTAPDGVSTNAYTTTLGNIGPSHIIDPTLYMGSCVDAEADGQPSATAVGDDGADSNSPTCADDEDGVVFTTPILPGDTAQIEVTVSQACNLSAWIDYNGDGLFNHANEQIAADEAMVSGVNTLNLIIPTAGTAPGQATLDIETFTRFRCSTDSGLSYDGPATDGEVEDHMVLIGKADFGDAPDPDFPTTLGNNGARHIIPTPFTAANPYLGACVDPEADGLQSMLANGDDNGDTDESPTAACVGNDDEDGVTFSGDLLQGGNLNVDIDVSNVDCTVSGWIDWNNDGDWDDTGENIIVGQLATIAGPNSYPIGVPNDAVVGVDHISRFRCATTASEVISYTGRATDGEVEDYLVEVKGIDYGDAPETGTAADGVSTNDYDVTLANTAGSHVISPTIYLGAGIDGELDGQPTVGADGDDSAGTIPDDEDGVNIDDAMFFACETTELEVVASAPGFLNAWIDVDGDGTWNDATEQLVTDQAVISGTNSVSVTIPCTAQTTDPTDANNVTYARFRYNTTAGVVTDPTGQAPDGEVEDYALDIKPADRGDLPNSFDTLASDLGPGHAITNTLHLGGCVDADGDGQAAADGFAGVNGSDGDDGNGVVGDATGTCATPGDDEDGVQLVTPLTPGEQACVLVSAVNTTGSDARLMGWIDFDGDGQFDGDTDDLISTGDFAGGRYLVGNGGITNQELCFTTPAGATFAGGETHLRWRLTTDDLSVIQAATPWNGFAMDGEVEDYYQPLACVGSYVWHDTDGKGDQDETAAGIENVTVNLVWYGPDNALGGGDDRVYSDQTDANGEYHFCGLLPSDSGNNRGSYEIQIPAAELVSGELANMTLSPTGNAVGTNQDTNGTQSSASDPVLGGTFVIGQPDLGGVNPIFSLPTGEDGTGDDAGNLPTSADAYPDSSDDVSYDFAFFVEVEIGNRVWIESDNDGDATTGTTTPVTSTVVTAIGEGGEVYTATTDATGYYTMTVPANRTYTVTVGTPADAVPSAPTGGLIATDNDPGTDEDMSHDPSGTVVTVGTTDNRTIDFGFFKPVAVGNVVWIDDGAGGGTALDGILDPNEQVVSDVVIELYEAGDDPTVDTPILTTTTSISGTYLFDMIPQGDYVVHIPASEFAYGEPLSSFISSNGNGGDDTTDDEGNENGIDNAAPQDNGISSVTLELRAGDEPTAESGEGSYVGTLADDSANMTIDFGFFELLTLGNMVWFDTNNNGEIDGSESGVPAGIVLNLLDENGDPVLHPISGEPITTTTDAAGNYVFTHLYPGEYIVEVGAANFQLGEPLEDYISSPGSVDPDSDPSDIDDSGVDGSDPTIEGIRTIPVTLAYDDEPDNGDDTDDNDNTNLTIDIGISEGVEIGTQVWIDSDNDGDATTGTIIPVPGVVVTAVSSSGTVYTTTTDASGNYTIIVPVNGAYTVTVQTPPNTVSAVPVGGVIDTDDDPGNDDQTSHTPGVIVTVGVDDNDTIDFGFFLPVAIGNVVWIDDGAGGGTALNSIIDGSELGAANVVVELYFAGDTPGVSTPVMTTTTSATGEYLFDMLAQDSYIVHIPASEFALGQPLVSFVSSTGSGGDDLNDDDADENGIDNADPSMNGISSVTIVLDTGAEPATESGLGSYPGSLADTSVNMTVDFGFFELLTLGNQIWFDENDNGIFDVGEQTVGAGVVLYLLDGDSNPVLHPITNQPISVTTGPNGTYQFTNLYPSEYRVQIGPENFAVGAPLEGYASSTGSTDPDNNEDRDDNGNDSDDVLLYGIISSPVTLDYGNEPDNNEDTDDNDNTNLSVDFGLVLIPTAVDLIRFTALRSGPDSIEIWWETGAEINNFGFRLLRSSTGSFSDAEQIHFESSAVTTGPGAMYSYIDEGLAEGTYSYWLVDVETDGDEALHGPITFKLIRGYRQYLPVITWID